MGMRADPHALTLAQDTGARVIEKTPGADGAAVSSRQHAMDWQPSDSGLSRANTLNLITSVDDRTIP